MPRYRAEVVFTFDAAALTEGGRRLRELSSAAESVGFAMERARADVAPLPSEDPDVWTSYAPPEPETSGVEPPGGRPPARGRAAGAGAATARGRVGKWLRSQGIDVDAVERTFPGTGWS